MALIYAAQNGHLNEVKRLIEQGYDVNERQNDKHGYTALNWACQQGYIDVVQWLIEEGGADMNQRDLQGYSCLYRAAGDGNLTIVKYLAEMEPSLIHEALWSACFEGCEEIVEYLLSKGANVEKKGNWDSTPIIIASQQGHLSIVKLLVRAKANIEATDVKARTAFYLAARNNQVSVMTYLAEIGADINKTRYDNASPLFQACELGRVEAVKFLVERQADVERAVNGLTPLMRVCQTGVLELVKVLVEQGSADILKLNGNKSALDYAKDGNHQELVKYLEGLLSINISLIKRGMKNDAYTPLWLACRDGHLQRVKMIMKHFDRSFIEKKAPDGTSPITMAYFKEHSDILNYFKNHHQLEIQLEDTTNLPDEETDLTKFSRKFPVFNENVEKKFSNPFPQAYSLSISAMEKHIISELCPFRDFSERWNQNKNSKRTLNEESDKQIAFIGEITPSTCLKVCKRY